MSERRNSCVLVATMRADDRLVARLGATEAAHAAERCRNRIERAIDAHGGSVLSRQAEQIVVGFDQCDAAVLAASDMLALGVLQGLKDVGRRVPHDVALIGFDGIRAGTLADPALTTLEPDLDAAGEALVAMALEDDERTRSGTRIPVRLAVRGTA